MQFNILIAVLLASFSLASQNGRFNNGNQFGLMKPSTKSHEKDGHGDIHAPSHSHSHGDDEHSPSHSHGGDENEPSHGEDGDDHEHGRKPRRRGRKPCTRSKSKSGEKDGDNEQGEGHEDGEGHGNGGNH